MMDQEYTDAEGEEQVVRCPICNADATEECEHLFAHGDDLQTRSIVGSGAWEEFSRLKPGFLPEFASAFFQKFGRKFPALHDCERKCWGGFFPGLDGVYYYVWAKDTNSLAVEIEQLLELEIQPARRRNRAKPH